MICRKDTKYELKHDFNMFSPQYWFVLKLCLHKTKGKDCQMSVSLYIGQKCPSAKLSGFLIFRAGQRFLKFPVRASSIVHRVLVFCFKFYLELFHVQQDNI